MNSDKFISIYCDYLKNCNYSDKTVKEYHLMIKHFIQFCKKYYPRIKEITKITKDVIFDYQNFLTCYKNNKGKHLSSSTRYNKLISVKNFFSFLEDEDYILKNPAYNLKMPKIEKTLPRNILTVEEILLILNSIKLNSPINMRNKAIIEVFYACGIRPFELCNIKITDIDLKQQLITIIKGKGRKTRIVPIGQYASEYIKLYLEKARKHLLKGNRKDEGYLFISKSGKKMTNNDLNKNVMDRAVKGLNINKKVTSYTFRHSCATHLIQNKVDIKYVADLLGHASVRTTQVYCHLDVSDLQKMHSLHHPREVQNNDVNKIKD